MFVNETRLRAIVDEAARAAVEQALTVEWTLERRTGDDGRPLRVPEIRTEKVFLPSILVQQFYRHEGALRGLQEDLGKHAVSAAEIRRLAESIEAARPMLERLDRVLQQLARPRALPPVGNGPETIEECAG